MKATKILSFLLALACLLGLFAACSQGGGVVADGFLYQKILKNLNPHTIRFVTNGIKLTELDPHYIGLLGACSNAVIGMEKNV